MPIRRIAVAVVAFVLVGCGGGDDESSTPTTRRPSTTVTTYGGIPGVAQGRSCEQDVRTLQQVSDFYKASHGAPAPSLQTFVDDGTIESLPGNDHGYVISYDASTGKVSAAGACTYP
jgi:hypothetical protein